MASWVPSCEHFFKDLLVICLCLQGFVVSVQLVLPTPQREHVAASWLEPERGEERQSACISWFFLTVFSRSSAFLPSSSAFFFASSWAGQVQVQTLMVLLRCPKASLSHSLCIPPAFNHGVCDIRMPSLYCKARERRAIELTDKAAVRKLWLPLVCFRNARSVLSSIVLWHHVLECLAGLSTPTVFGWLGSELDHVA